MLPALCRPRPIEAQRPATEPLKGDFTLRRWARCLGYPKSRPIELVSTVAYHCGAYREGLGRTGLENIARKILVREGVAAIWQLHLAAARAYRGGLNEAATGIVEIADAAEREWLQGKVVVRGSPG